VPAVGFLDPTFGTGGAVLTPGGFDALLVQPDGKTVVAGSSMGELALTRYNTDGSLDNIFGSGGRVVEAAFGGAGAAALQSDGKIVVVSGASLVRFTINGELDTSFGGGDGWVSTPIDASHMAIKADGRIVVNSYYDYAGFAVAQFLSSGEVDTSFGTGGIATADFGSIYQQAYGVAVQPDGKVVVVGRTNMVSDGEVQEALGFAVARFTDKGKLDNTFSGDGKATADFSPTPGVNDEAYAAVVQADGSIVVAGRALSYSGGLARFTATGVLDTAFGGGDGMVVTTDFNPELSSGGQDIRLAVQSDGKIVVAGGSNVARFTTSGALDPSFGLSGKTTVGFDARGVAIQPTDGKIVVAGNSGANLAVARFLLVGVNVTGTNGNDNITVDPGTQAGTFKITFNGTPFDNLAGPVYIDGGNGSDSYTVNFGNWAGPVTITDRGTSGGDNLFV
jgi:uncharacterized delta-60 repeat protein